MRHGDDGAGIIVQEALQPGHRFGVEMVGRLVEEEHVGALQQEAAEGDAAALAARELGHVRIARRAAQRVHGDLDGAVELPAVAGVDLLLQLALLGDELVHLVVAELLGEARRDRLEAVDERLGRRHPLHDVAGDVLLGVERRLLGEIADRGALGGPGFADEIRVDPGHDAQEAGLARAVDAEHADLGAGQEGEIDLLEHLAAAGIGLAQPLHDMDVLIGGHLGLRLSRSCAKAAVSTERGGRAQRRREDPATGTDGRRRQAAGRTGRSTCKQQAKNRRTVVSCRRQLS